MSEIEFKVGYRWSVGKANPLFNDKREMLITFSVPDEMYPNVETFPYSYFDDIMRSVGYDSKEGTLEDMVYKKGNIVIQFKGKDAFRSFSISIYTPDDVDSSELGTKILNDLKGEFVRKLKLKANPGSSSSSSSAVDGDPKNVDGGRKRLRKTRKSKKSRSRKQKKTRKH